MTETERAEQGAAILKNIAKYIQAKNKVLWTGTWETGSITVPEAENYETFRIFCNSLQPIDVARSGQYLLGAGGCSYEGNIEIIAGINMTISGNTLTMRYPAVRFTHTPEGNHTAVVATNIVKIVGVDPIMAKISGEN